MVKTASVTGTEVALADWVAEKLGEVGAEVTRIGNSVIARAGTGKRLMLDSHLDTVPLAQGWTRDPWGAEVVDGKVYGLGSNDAKASGAAMLAAFSKVAQEGGPCEVVLALVEQEETTNIGTLNALHHLRSVGWLPEAAVVGEPTGLQIGVAQRGLLLLELVATGDVCHSARAKELGARNAILALAQELVKVEGLNLGPDDPFLGSTTAQVTVLKAGDVHNRLPAEAIATMDVRTVPSLTHDELVALVRRQLDCEVRVRSKRLEPYACPADDAIVLAAMAAQPEAKAFGSATLSDQVHFHGIPCIKVGPGESVRSHTTDEFVLEEEVVAGARFYERLVQEFAKS
jgi:acetylornithine deacetylase